MVNNQPLFHFLYETAMLVTAKIGEKEMLKRKASKEPFYLNMPVCINLLSHLFLLFPNWLSSVLEYTRQLEIHNSKVAV